MYVPGVGARVGDFVGEGVGTLVGAGVGEGLGLGVGGNNVVVANINSMCRCDWGTCPRIEQTKA